MDASWISKHALSKSIDEYKQTNSNFIITTSSNIGSTPNQSPELNNIHTSSPPHTKCPLPMRTSSHKTRPTTHFLPLFFLRNALEPTVTNNEIQTLVNDGAASANKLAILLKESLAVRETAHGPTAPVTLKTLCAIPQYTTGAEAEAYHRLAIARYDEIGEKRSVTGSLYILGCKLNA
jgi:hypothetical protein